MRILQLLEDEKKKLSVARIGVWVTLTLAVGSIALDIYATIVAGKAVVPNAAYALESTMFLTFCSWAAGPRIAAHIGPQIGSAAYGIASAVRDVRLPSRHDDESGR